MEELSGLVAILSPDLTVVADIRDLGENPVPVKPGRVLPLEDLKPPLGPGESYGSYSFVVGPEVVQRVWSVLPAPTPEELRAAMPALNPAQIRLALFSIGITEAMVESHLAGDPEGLIEWQSRPSYQRLHPLVVALAAPDKFNLPAEQIDALWMWAKGL